MPPLIPPGRGTRFEVFLPVLPQLALRPSSLSPFQDPAAHIPPARVLLVEDDNTLRTFLDIVLRREGLVLTTHMDADSAAAACEACAADFDLLVTDIVMPGKLDGTDLARRLRRQNPALCVLLMTGYSEQLLQGLVLDDNGPAPHLLRKPFDRSSLLAAIQIALASRPSAGAKPGP